MSETSMNHGLDRSLFVLASAIVVIIIVAMFFYGAAWVGAKLLPWLWFFTWVALVTVIFVLLPLAIPRTTRSFAGMGIFIASYVFGVTLWVTGLELTLTIWGIEAVIIGVVLGGVGVVPIAMLATLIHGQWLWLSALILLTIATFGCRGGALTLAEKCA